MYLEVNVDNEFLSWAVKNKNKVDVFFNALHGNGEKMEKFKEY